MEESFVYNVNRNTGFKPMIDKKWFMLSPRQSLQVKTREEIIEEYGSLENMPGYHPNLKLGYVFGKKFQNSPRFMYNISQCGFRNTSIAKEFRIPDSYYYACVPLSAIKIVNTKKIDAELEKEEPEDESKIGYSIRIIDKDKKKEIMDEMISKVDRNVLSNLFAIANRNKKVDSDIIDKYLQEWALSKYEYYLMFGRELKIEEKKEIRIDDQELDFLIRDLINKFDYKILSKIPKEDFINNKISNIDIFYANAFDDFIGKVYDKYYAIYPMFMSLGKEAFISDKLPKNDLHEKYFDGKYVPGESTFDFLEENIPEMIWEDIKDDMNYMRNLFEIRAQNGMKLSKFLSKVFDNNEFDIELSKVLQNRNQKGYIAISINPIDYLMMSMNKHGWSSCQRVIRGCFSSAPFSYMMDEPTLIAYMHNGNIYHYDNIKFNTATVGSVTYGESESVDFGEFGFDYLSFKNRELVYMDKDTCGCAFALGYCNMAEETYKQIRLLVEHVISKHLGIDEKWVVAKPTNGKNTDRSINSRYKLRIFGSQVYLDPVQSFAYIKGVSNIYDTEFNVGVDHTYCLNCGNICKNTTNRCGVCDR